MKKQMSVVLVAAMCLSLVACGGGMDKDTKNIGESRDKSKVYCFADTVISEQDYDEALANAALSEFALRMLEENLTAREEDTENVLISPTSMITALGMTSFGAKGDTLTQMEEVFGLSRGHLNYYNSQYLGNTSEVLKLANSIWFTNDDRLTVKQEFLQFNEEYYGADIYETAFNDATVDSINHWIEENTDGMIKDILDKIPSDAVMYLINALAFEAEWESKYDSTQVRESSKFVNCLGERQNVTMMYSEESLYLEDTNAKGFIKYYKDRDYAFAALLPKEGMTVEEYVQTLTGESLQNLLANPQQVAVLTRMPEFSYEYDVELSEAFEELGMTAAFSSATADFSDMATSTDGNIFINRILHKTFIEVSPQGTKAGAATVVEMMNESCPVYEEMKEVYLDRPFLYMIIDCDSNMPVFIGAVNDLS